MFYERSPLAIGNLARARARLVMTAGGVLIGTTAVILLIALTFGLQRAAEAGIGSSSALTEIQVYPNYGGGPGGSTPDEIPQLTVDAVKAFWTIPGVAAVIPMVLGSKGEPLDVGRSRRLVTGGLRAALWQRDQGCSFPGCSIPPQWTDAHHVVYWWVGGRTSLLNTALLCRRHHTHVHRHELTATVTATSVTWHV